MNKSIPDVCLLEPGVKGQALILPGMGLIFFIVGSFMAVALPRRIKKRQVLESAEQTDFTEI